MTPERTDLTGSVCLITGASSGIGLETARSLARRGATVVNVSRGSGKGAAVTEGLRRETGGDLHYLSADLSSLAEVRRVADDFKARFNKLDVLVNNAGAFFSERQTTVDGFEKTFALNHLAYFGLTHLLLEPLLSAPAARVVNVSSQAEAFGRVRFDDLMLERSYNGWRAYSQSKLANLLFSYELARRLAEAPVTVNALHPGGVASGFGAGNRGLGALLLRAVRPFFKTPEEGAKTAVYLAASGEVAGISGRYFVDEKPASSSRRSHDREVQARLWEVSEELVKLSDRQRVPSPHVERAA